jgi:hypothetical protein
MTINQAFIIVIEEIMKDIKNLEMIYFLTNICEDLNKYPTLEEDINPRRKSIMKFGYNIFTFTNQQYLEMARYIKTGE